MIFLCEEEAEADLFQHLERFFRILRDVRAEGFLHIRRAGLRGCRTVAVLGDLHARRCDNKSNRGGNIEAVRAITAGTYDLQDLHARMRDWRRMLSHRFCTAGDLIDRLRPRALR